MCRCGAYPGFHTHKPVLNAMTTKDLKELLDKFGHGNADIRDDGTGRINIITTESLSVHQQEQVEASAPAGVRVLFTTKIKAQLKVPQGLEKWARDTAKELKKL